MDRKTAPLFDGCHKYGWLITIIISVLMWLMAQAETHQQLLDMKEYFNQRITRLESQIDSLSHITRGLQEPSR